MIRVAAVGDVHFGRDSAGRLAEHFGQLKAEADILLIAGDLTQTGTIEEGNVLVNDLKLSPVPVVAVLGNHDYHSDQDQSIIRALQEIGVYVLDRSSVTLNIGRFTVGIAGVKGFGGGYAGRCGSSFGEQEMKSFIAYTREEADALRDELNSLETDFRIALMHYSPIPETLLGEPKEIYPFLGSYLLAEPIDEAKPHIVFHGHAHKGIEKGVTPGGIPVRNVAQPVIRHAFNIYCIDSASQRLLG